METGGFERAAGGGVLRGGAGGEGTESEPSGEPGRRGERSPRHAAASGVRGKPEADFRLMFRDVEQHQAPEELLGRRVEDAQNRETATFQSFADFTAREVAHGLGRVLGQGQMGVVPHGGVLRSGRVGLGVGLGQRTQQHSVVGDGQEVGESHGSS